MHFSEPTNIIYSSQSDADPQHQNNLYNIYYIIYNLDIIFEINIRKHLSNNFLIIQKQYFIRIIKLNATSKN